MHLFLPNLNCGRYLKSLMAIGRQIMKISTKYTIYWATPRINSQKKDVQGIPSLKKRNGSGLAELAFEKAGKFNGQFADVFTKTEHSQVPLLNRKVPFVEDIVVSKESVTKFLKGLNPSKALGLDELHESLKNWHVS